MDFATTPEQDRLVAAVTTFARQELSAPDGEAEAVFARRGWKAAAEFGVLGWPVPRRYGGAELDPLTCVLALEALGYGCTDNGLLFVINNHLWACTAYLVEQGSDEQRARFLPGLCDGTLIGAHAMTEPDAGSDLLSMTTRARRDGDRYVLTGTKTFISNAPIADLFVVFARSDLQAPAQRGLSAFLVRRDSPGLRVTRTLEKSGLRGCPMGELVLDEVPVPVADRLGAEGGGYQVFTASADWERGFLMASQVGTLRRLLETAVRHASGRRQFGQPIGAFQAVGHRVADIRVDLELARLMLYKVGWLKREGRLAMLETSMFKLFLSESLVRAALTAQRVFGARGYLTEYGVEREVRDALLTTTYAGSSDIQRSIIAQLSAVADGG